MSAAVTYPSIEASSSKGTPRAALLTLTILVICGFGLHLTHALRLKAAGAMYKPDILFNADSDLALRAFTVGWANPRLKHPNLSNFITPPVRVASWAIARITNNSDREAFIREKIALSVAPLIGAARMIVLFSLGCVLGMSPWGALALCSLDIVSASGLVFGSIPESYVMNGFGLACILWLGAAALRLNRRPHWMLWIAVGVFATGVTISNIVPFTAMLLFVNWAHEKAFSPAFWNTAKLVAAVVAASLLIWSLSYVAIQNLAAKEILAESHTAKGEGLHTSHDVLTVALGESRYLHGNPGGKLAQFPIAFLDTLVAPKPLVLRYDAPVDIVGGPDIMFTLDGPVRRPLPLLLLATAIAILLCVGAWAWFTMDQSRPFLSACGTVLLFKIGLHMFYGDELFLYSQDWQVILTVLISGVFFLRGPASAVIRITLPVLIVAMLINNLSVLHFIERTLESPLVTP